MSFIKELKQRNVFRVGIAYVVVAWLIAQATELALDSFAAPDWVIKTILFLLLIGFPIALVFAWAFELTPEGIKKDKDVDRSASVPPATGRKLDFFIIAALVVALGFVIVDQYVLEEPAPATIVSENLRSIAVLPFDNRSAEEENAAFFADGVHDELLTRLSRIGDLTVISRTSVMEYRDTTKNMRQIGAELGVGSILEGAVQRAGDTVRINVQLIDAQADKHLWAEIYNRDLTATNIFEIQTEISTEIANALRAELSPDEKQRIADIPTENLDALQAFFAGNQMVDRRDTQSLQSAIEYFKRATGLDPEFTAAYAGLAEAWLQLSNRVPPADLIDARSNAGDAVRRAVELDPESPDALAILGWYDLLQDYDWQGAAKSFDRALKIEPTNTNALHWYSHLLSFQGNHDRSIEMAETALALDPLSILMKMDLVVAYRDAGRWEEAFSLGEKALRQDQSEALMAVMWDGLLQAGRANDAAAMFKDWAEATDRNAAAAQELGAAFIQFQQTGTPVEGLNELIQRLQFGYTSLPRVYAAVGDKQKSIGALQTLHLRRTGGLALFNMKINSAYDFIRDDPRFVGILEQIGLAD